MRRYLLFFILFSLSVVNAKEPVAIQMDAACLNSKQEVYILKISSNRLYLTEEALQETVGGYVEIPADSYYIKTKNKVYKIEGVVERNSESGEHQFKAMIDYATNPSITLQEFYHFQNAQELQIIQKIELTEKNFRTTALNLSLDEMTLKSAVAKCHEQLAESKSNRYIPVALGLILIGVVLYIFRRKTGN